MQDTENTAASPTLRVIHDFRVCAHAPLNIETDGHPDARVVSLGAEVEALHCRVLRHSPRRRPEMLAMLNGALRAAQRDVQEGQRLLAAARVRFREVTQTHNQLLYMAGALGGAIVGLLIAFWILHQAPTTGTVAPSPWMKNLAEPSTVATLCIYGLIGSLTSIFTRLSSMQLAEIDSPTTVIVMGVVQPFIALGFVSVIYLILQHELFGISLKAGTDSKLAPIWVAAFLCGFSERFAPGILDSAGKLMGSRDLASRPGGPGARSGEGSVGGTQG